MSGGVSNVSGAGGAYRAPTLQPIGPGGDGGGSRVGDAPATGGIGTDKAVSSGRGETSGIQVYGGATPAHLFTEADRKEMHANDVQAGLVPPEGGGGKSKDGGGKGGIFGAIGSAVGGLFGGAAGSAIGGAVGGLLDG